jgi:hypothetical protein
MSSPVWMWEAPANDAELIPSRRSASSVLPGPSRGKHDVEHIRDPGDQHVDHGSFFAKTL